MEKERVFEDVTSITLLIGRGYLADLSNWMENHAKLTFREFNLIQRCLDGLKNCLQTIEEEREKV